MRDPNTIKAEARVSTPRPARYLEQLCKHFGHRLPVSRAEGGASITFSSGLCQLAAEVRHVDFAGVSRR